MFADDLTTISGVFGDVRKIYFKIGFLLHLSADQRARFELHVAEAIAILREAFGEQNEYLPLLRKALAQYNSNPDNGQLAVQSAKTVLDAAASRLKRTAVRQAAGEGTTYIHQRRLEELRSVKSGRWDLVRLITMLEELNAARANECLMSIAMLQRAILDHVPPIFGFKTFTEVSNNYSGGKSVSEQFKRLDNSVRQVADFYMHRHIQAKETLPTPAQVTFGSEMDTLLAEIWRLLR